MRIRIPLLMMCLFCLSCNTDDCGRGTVTIIFDLQHDLATDTIITSDNIIFEIEYPESISTTFDGETFEFITDSMDLNVGFSVLEVETFRDSFYEVSNDINVDFEYSLLCGKDINKSETEYPDPSYPVNFICPSTCDESKKISIRVRIKEPGLFYIGFRQPFPSNLFVPRADLEGCTKSVLFGIVTNENKNLHLIENQSGGDGIYVAVID